MRLHLGVALYEDASKNAVFYSQAPALWEPPTVPNWELRVYLQYIQLGNLGHPAAVIA